MLCGYSRCLIASVTLACLVWGHWLKRKLYNKTLLTEEHSLHKPFWQLQLVFLTFDEDVLGSRCVCDSPGQVAALWVPYVAASMLWYAILPNLQAYTQASTLSACFKNKKFPVSTVIYSVMCLWCISFSPFQLCSIIIWTCRGHCILNETFACQSVHNSHLLRLGLWTW